MEEYVIIRDITKNETFLSQKQSPTSDDLPVTQDLLGHPGHP